MMYKEIEHSSNVFTVVDASWEILHSAESKMVQRARALRISGKVISGGKR